jgi:catechol 2,3-dioxygenase-like lactoylglutathione lyase family enzyme
MRTRVHLNLEVADLDPSIAFYTRLFGAGPTKVRADYANWRLDEPALHLALVAHPGRGKPRSGEHFGVELFEAEALKDWRARAEAAGLALRVEEQVTCCYAVADKWWAADPDGNEWEFWVRSAEAERLKDGAMPLETVPGGACCAPAPDGTACCAPPRAAGAGEETP